MSYAESDGRPFYNRILSLLPREEYERIAPHIDFVELSLRKTLYQPDAHITYVYFPFSGTVSLTAVMADGHEVEVGVIGREGMAGMPVFLGTDSAPLKAMVQVSGSAARLSAESFLAESARGGELHRLLLRYAQAFFVQTASTAACNRLHTLEQRLAKWLLTTRDRAQSDELDLTHEFLSMMLGVRRAGVSEAMSELARAGLVACQRGRIRVVDARGLEMASCECYGVIRREFDRLLGEETSARWTRPNRA